MRVFKPLLITIAWALAIPMSHAISLDSLLNLPAMGIPVLNYSPESTWEFGAAAQGYFRLPNQERTSIVQIDGTYSLNHQWYINAQGNLYFGSPDSGVPKHKSPTCASSRLPTATPCEACCEASRNNFMP